MEKETKYKFFKKIIPGTSLFCVSMQISVIFTEEVWIGVVSEHTTWCTGDKKLFYGNIFKNTTSLFLTHPDIEFEVWEDAQTEGERYMEKSDVPPKISMPLFVDLPYDYGESKSLVDCILPNKNLNNRKYN